MTDETPLDAAHAAMQAMPEDATARMGFYHTLADTELFLLLEGEAEGDRIAPRVFDVGDQVFALVFDTVERLAEFVGGSAPFAALPGRVLAEMLAAQSVGLGVNLDTAPSSILIPPEAVQWLSETLAMPAPGQVEVKADALSAPGGLPETLLQALDAKLARAAGLAHSAYLAGLRTQSGGQGHLLIFVDAVPGAEDALARAISEALVFSGIEAGMLDVGFVAASDPVAARLARVGLRFDLPEPAQPAQPASAGPRAPGMDPDRPPILK